MSIQQRNTSIYKRKELEDITNTYGMTKHFNLDIIPSRSAFDDTKMTETEQQSYQENTQTMERNLE